MRKFSTLFLGATILFLLLWQIPWLYSFLVTQKEKAPFVLFSPILNDFTFSKGEGKKYIHTDPNGNQFTQQQIDSLHPVFYARQLMSDSRFPDSIGNAPADYKNIQHHVFYFRHSPRDINRPVLGVWQMMESLSGRVKLETPEDVFRIDDQGITFVDIATNQTHVSKSARFTKAMKQQQFVFPASYIVGNPVVKKDYDEGYLMLDSEKKLFHIKQVKGRPYVEKIDLPENIVPKHLFITEFKNRSILGFLTDEKNHFYAISTKGHELTRIDIPQFVPEENAVMIYGMVYQWTVKVSSKEKVCYYALDGETLSLIKSYEVPDEPSLSKTVEQYLSRLAIRFSSPLDKFIYPRLGA